MPVFPTQGNQVSPWATDNPISNYDNLLGVGLGLLSGKNAQDQVGQAATNFVNGRNMQRTVNKTLQYLQQNNPDLAEAVRTGALDPHSAFKLAYQQKIEAQKPKNNFMSVGGSLYDTSSGQWISPPAGAGGAEYGLNPIYGTDAEGNTGIGQVGKDGTFHIVDTKGFKPVGSTTQQNLGTTFVNRDRAGNVIATTPIDTAGKNAQEELGTAQGKAIAAAPGDLQAGQNALDTIESLRNDPYKARGTGFSSMGNVIPGTGGYDFSNKVDQAKSGAFLTAIQQMRGLGSLSNAEGGAATAAVNRMNTATSEQEFNAALDDYEKIVRQGMARAQSRLQGGGGAAAPAQAPGATSSGVKWSIEP